MIPTNNEISNEFSKGNFRFCYNHFSPEVKWKIIGNRTVKGREDVIAYCEQMNAEMASSTLTNSNMVTEGNSVVIEGSCTFFDTANKPGEVSYCDIYRYAEGKITNITSYCISESLS